MKPVAKTRQAAECVPRKVMEKEFLCLGFPAPVEAGISQDKIFLFLSVNKGKINCNT